MLRHTDRPQPRRRAREYPATIVCTVALFVILACMIWAGTSNAAVTAPPEGWGNAYMRAALEYWHQPATRCADTEISFDDPRPLSFTTDAQREAGERILGRATVTTGDDQRCYMWIAPLRGFGIYFRCVLFAHEFGHWLGFPDSPADPRTDVRAEMLGNYTHDSACRRLVRRVHR
jgi:hypothetical protein